MTKKKKQKKHAIKANMRVLEMTKAGSAMEFEIFSNREKLGKIVIGRGSFEWTGKGKWADKSKKINWTRFSSMMNKYCYGEG